MIYNELRSIGKACIKVMQKGNKFKQRHQHTNTHTHTHAEELKNHNLSILTLNTNGLNSSIKRHK